MCIQAKKEAIGWRGNVSGRKPNIRTARLKNNIFIISTTGFNSAIYEFIKV